eukprot:TRINITY_DN81953_c0_g1_i2.p1 TRINITY_DN81953_c0_g1~~TRINITY_DN81953_c0_g1_i2.p1  ORF type:complete len:235 (-),score=41.78 TRINITY_DN81953_c0_g1_i2:23-727(-)
MFSKGLNCCQIKICKNVHLLRGSQIFKLVRERIHCKSKGFSNEVFQSPHLHQDHPILIDYYLDNEEIETEDEDEFNKVKRKARNRELKQQNKRAQQEEMDVMVFDHKSYKEWKVTRRKQYKKKKRDKIRLKLKYDEMARKLEAERLKRAEDELVRLDPPAWNSKEVLLAAQKRDYEERIVRRKKIMQSWLEKAKVRRGLEDLPEEDWELLERKEKGISLSTQRQGESLLDSTFS